MSGHILPTSAGREDRACRRPDRPGRAGRGDPGQRAAGAAAAAAGAGRSAAPGPARGGRPRRAAGRCARAAADRGTAGAADCQPAVRAGQRRGPLGFLRDAWHMAQDPQGFSGTMQPGDIKPTAPPPGAGPAPQLPSGYQSLTDPASSGPVPEGNYEGGPPLPGGTTPSAGHRHPDTSIRRPPRMRCSRSTRMRCRRPGPLPRPDAVAATPARG